MTPLSRLGRAMLYGAVLTAVLVSPATATRTRDATTPALEVYVSTGVSPLRAEVRTAPSPGVPTRIELDVPTGYAFDVSGARGAQAADVAFSFNDASPTGGGGAFANVPLLVDDAAAYSSDPAAQICAPGTHAAAWSGTTSVAGQTFRLLAFVDRGQSGGDTVIFCPSGLSGTSQTSVNLTFYVVQPVTTPTAPGTYTWRALVTPRGADQYELRAVSILPSSLTLKATHDVKRKNALISGRLTAGGTPVAHAPIVLDVTVGNTTRLDDSTAATTSADGRFSTTRAIKTTSDYTASVEPTAGSCAPPAAAPGGCLSQTIVPPAAAFATVFVRAKGDAVRAYTTSAQALAAREQLQPDELPAGSAAVAPGLHLCDSHHPPETRLTVNGEAQSPLYTVVEGSLADPSTLRIVEVSATTRVYRSRADAKAALAGEATLAVARCLLDRGTGFAAKSTAAFPQHPATVRAFVDTIDLLGPTGRMELVFILRGRSVARLIVFGTGTSTRPVALDLERRLAARLR